MINNKYIRPAYALNLNESDEAYYDVIKDSINKKFNSAQYTNLVSKFVSEDLKNILDGAGIPFNQQREINKFYGNKFMEQDLNLINMIKDKSSFIYNKTLYTGRQIGEIKSTYVILQGLLKNPNKWYPNMSKDELYIHQLQLFNEGDRYINNMIDQGLLNVTPVNGGKTKVITKPNNPNEYQIKIAKDTDGKYKDIPHSVQIKESTWTIRKTDILMALVGQLDYSNTMDNADKIEAQKWINNYKYKENTLGNFVLKSTNDKVYGKQLKSNLFTGADRDKRTIITSLNKKLEAIVNYIYNTKVEYKKRYEINKLIFDTPIENFPDTDVNKNVDMIQKFIKDNKDNLNDVIKVDDEKEKEPTRPEQTNEPHITLKKLLKHKMEYQTKGQSEPYDYTSIKDDTMYTRVLQVLKEVGTTQSNAEQIAQKFQTMLCQYLTITQKYKGKSLYLSISSKKEYRGSNVFTSKDKKQYVDYLKTELTHPKQIEETLQNILDQISTKVNNTYKIIQPKLPEYRENNKKYLGLTK